MAKQTIDSTFGKFVSPMPGIWPRRNYNNVNINTMKSTSDERENKVSEKERKGWRKNRKKCEQFGQTNSKHHQHLFTFVRQFVWGARMWRFHSLFRFIPRNGPTKKEVNKKQKLQEKMYFFPFVCYYYYLLVVRSLVRWCCRECSLLCWECVFLYFPFGTRQYTLETWQSPSPSSRWCDSNEMRVNIFAVWFILFFCFLATLGLVCYSIIILVCVCKCVSVYSLRVTYDVRFVVYFEEEASACGAVYIAMLRLLLALNECLFLLLWLLRWCALRVY